MNQWWFKLHRGILEKPIWTEATAGQKWLLIYVIDDGKSFIARPGQFITSLPALVQKCGKSSSVQKSEWYSKDLRITNF